MFEGNVFCITCWGRRRESWSIIAMEIYYWSCVFRHYTNFYYVLTVIIHFLFLPLTDALKWNLVYKYMKIMRPGSCLVLVEWCSPWTKKISDTYLSFHLIIWVIQEHLFKIKAIICSRNTRVKLVFGLGLKYFGPMALENFEY